MKTRRIPEIYYIGDLHLYNKKILRPERPGSRDFPTIYDMADAIAENWRGKVHPWDTVYIVGDVAERHPHEAAEYLKALPGRKILITGNHDLDNLSSRTFRSAFFDIHIYQRIRDKGREVILFHYPMEEWERFWAGAYHIHSHVHLNKDHLRHVPRRFNASVEENGYSPVTLDEMIEKETANENRRI